eukprot:scaffold21607_cov61-Cyclotella_meneghiniana.AAC.2
MPDPELVRRVNSPYAIWLGVSSQNSLGVDMAEYQDFILAIVSAASGGGDGRILRYVLPCTKASPYVIVECSSIQTALELLSLGSLSVRVTEDQDPVTVLIFPVEQTPFSSILCPSLSVWHEKFGVAREEVSTLRANLQVSNQSCEDLQREIVDLTAQMNTLTLVQSEVTLLQSQLAEANSYVAKVLSQLAEEKSSHEMAEVHASLISSSEVEKRKHQKDFAELEKELQLPCAEVENYRGQLSVSEQKISELNSSLYDSVTKNEELVASKDKKISVSKNVLIERNVYVRRAGNLKTENDEKYALQMKYDQLVESHKSLQGRINLTDRSYKKLQDDYKVLQSHYEIYKQDYLQFNERAEYVEGQGVRT